MLCRERLLMRRWLLKNPLVQLLGEHAWDDCMYAVVAAGVAGLGYILCVLLVLVSGSCRPLPQLSAP